MTSDHESLRLFVYRSLASTGRAPSPEELTARFGPGARAALRALHDARHLVLDADDDVLMAHPFATIPLGFAVMGARTLWWGGCAWDSFALPHLLPDEPEVLVSTRCPACGAPHAWNVTRDAPPPGDQVAHFLVPVARMWDDVVRTCGNQRLFCGEACVTAWLDRTGDDRGYVMDLPTLWRLARRWYDGRLDRGYTRREPAAAAAYFREVGLAGPFWGLSGR
ncbi:organomercurial lyase [Actinomadura kijaniata]|uniref:organomercurial lyase n=1 Tax=Actinomadura kijaniata TaxID=46161 RepID=UPI00082F773B|nr:organomercurial lyase [Actinomadura kijaniata]